MKKTLYQFDAELHKTTERCRQLDIKVYRVERKRTLNDGDKALMSFVDVDLTTEKVYIVEYKGKTFEYKYETNITSFIKGLAVANGLDI